MGSDGRSYGPSHRRCLSIVGAGIGGGVAGCTARGGGDAGDGGPEDENGELEEESGGEPEREERYEGSEETEGKPEEADEGATGDDEAADGAPGSVRVSIRYDGERTGTVESDGSTRSVDGTAEFEVEGDPAAVSVNAQKRDGSDGELTVQILRDGEFVAEESTTAEHGVASASASFS